MYGASRHIASDVKEQIRRASYYGCVLCGRIPYHYHHIVPKFPNTTSHDPSRITLLCAYHHDQVTRGRIPNTAIMQAMLDPWSKSHQRNYERWYWPKHVFKVKFVGTTLQATSSIVVVNDVTIMGFENPLGVDRPVEINAVFHDCEGKQILHIVKNELRTVVPNVFDIEAISNALIITDNVDHDVALHLETNEEGVEIKRISSRYGDAHVIGDHDTFRVLWKGVTRSIFTNCSGTGKTGVKVTVNDDAVRTSLGSSC